MNARLAILVMLILGVSACGGAATSEPPTVTVMPPTADSTPVQVTESPPITAPDLSENTATVADAPSGKTLLIDLADGWTQTRNIPFGFAKDALVVTLITVPATLASQSLEDIANTNTQGQTGTVTIETLEANGQQVIRALIDQNGLLVDSYLMRLDDETVVTLTVQATTTDPAVYQDEVLEMVSSVRLG